MNTFSQSSQNRWWKWVPLSIASLLLISFLFFKSFVDTQAILPNPHKRVSILQMTEHSALNTARQGIIDTLTQENIQIEYETAQNNPGLAAQIAQKFSGSRPDVLIGIGTSSTQALISENREPFIPIIFTSVTDPVSARLVNDLRKPHRYISGVSDFIEASQEFSLFKKILTNLKRLGVIKPGEANSIILLEEMLKQAKVFNFQIIQAPAHSSAEIPQATQMLVKQVDAIFINNDNTALSAFDSITKIANAHKIPVFVSDTDMISRGALAAWGPNQYELGKQAAKMVIQVLNGAKLENMPVGFPDKTELHINLETALKLGREIPESVLHEATYKVNAL